MFAKFSQNDWVLYVVKARQVRTVLKLLDNKPLIPENRFDVIKSVIPGINHDRREPFLIEGVHIH